MVLFDNVFIPWDRVFYLRQSDAEDPSLYARLFQGAMGIGPWYVLVRMAVKAEVLLGICAAMAEYLGTAKQPHVQTGPGRRDSLPGDDEGLHLKR